MKQYHLKERPVMMAEGVILPKTSKTSKKGTAAKKKSTSIKKAVAKPRAKKETTKPKKAVKKKPSKKAPSKKDSEMLAELVIEIKSEDEQVCLGAIGRLGVLNHPDATRVLTIALADQRYMVRIHAAAQLGERNDKKSVDALAASLNDVSIFVRQTVAGALESIGGVKAKKAISKAEKDGLLLDELPEGKRLDD
jgi:HEAT repeat protein